MRLWPHRPRHFFHNPLRPDTKPQLRPVGTTRLAYALHLQRTKSSTQSRGSVMKARINTRLHTLFGALLFTGFSTAAVARTEAASDRYTVVLVARSVSKSCGEQDVRRELSVCHDAKGCYKHNLNQEPAASFRLPTSGSFSLVAKGPLADARKAFRTGDEIPERVTQELEGYGECRMSFTYRITR